MKNQSAQAAATARPTIPSITDPELIPFAVAADHAKLSGIISDEEHLEYLDALKDSRDKYSGGIIVKDKMRQLHTRILANLPAQDLHTPFKFFVLRDEFDVRPFFDVLEIGGAEDLAAVLDTFLSDLVRYLPAEDFTAATKNNLWHIRELRNAILTGCGGPQLNAWKRGIKHEEIGDPMDYRFLENRLK